MRPWMKPREVEIIQSLLERGRPKRILEWGAGYGTIFFSQNCKEFENWVSVEHIGEWAEKIRSMNTDPRVEIVHIEANNPVLTDPGQDGGYDNFKEYIEYPTQLEPFDLIIVDGRARTECLKKSRNLLRGNGIVILHDANRKHYRPFPTGFTDEILFEDYRTLEGGLWIASMDGAIDLLIDVSRHRQVWEVYQKYGRWLNLNV